MPDQPCAEQIRLSDAVATAVQILYAAKAARDRAEKAKQDVGPYDVLLEEARKAERFAVSALDQHRKEHHC